MPYASYESNRVTPEANFTLIHEHVFDTNLIIALKLVTVGHFVFLHSTNWFVISIIRSLALELNTSCRKINTCRILKNQNIDNLRISKKKLN